MRLGAKMVNFGGWSMPVQYTGILDEHHAVRGGLGVFDISHMGQFTVEGPGALAWLNGLLTNNVGKLDVGECQYTLLLNEAGVACLSGTAFGQYGEGHLRFSYANSAENISRALERMKDFLEQNRPA